MIRARAERGGFILRKGKRLFQDGDDRKTLELIDSRTFDTGVLYLTYKPAGEQGS
jgi:hypothetical protein